MTYRGVLSGDGQRIDGHWLIDDYSGAFLMVRNLHSFATEKRSEKVELDVTAS